MRRGYDAGRAMRIELLAVDAGAGAVVDDLLARYAREATARVERIVRFAESDRVPPRAGRRALRRDLRARRAAPATSAIRPRAAPPPQAASPLPADVAGTIVRAVERLTWPLGRRSLVAMLRGSVSAPPSARASLAFGVLEAASDAEVKRWIKALEAAGALVEVETTDGFRVLNAVPEAELPSLGPKSAGPVDDSVVERLRSWRRERSREDGVPAYVVLHDATLRDLAAARPASLHELAAVKGFGPTKIERYGDDVLAVVASSVASLRRLPRGRRPTRFGIPRTAWRCLCVDSTQSSLHAGGTRTRKLESTSCGFDEARRHRVRGAGFVSCVSSQCSPCWCCSRGRRSHSVWFAPSRARSRSSTPQRSDAEVDGVVYASNGRSVLAVLRGDESRVLLKDIDDVSPIMRQAIVSVEDRRFYEHNGVDARGIMRALVGGRALAGRRRGRLDDHAAVRQERLRPQPEDDRAQGARGGPRLAARAGVAEGSDPARLPEHDLLRQRRLRHPAGRRGRTSARAPAGSTLPEAALLAGLPADPSLYDPTQHPARCARSAATTCCRRCTTRGRSRCEQLRARLERRAAEGRGRPPPRHAPDAGQYFVNYVKDQLIAKYGAGRVFGGGLKVTSTIDLELQETAHKAIESDPQEAGRPCRRARRDRPAHRRRARDGRWLELPREPVQPRHPGRAAARLVVQADRARNRAAAGHLAGHDVRLEAGRHRRRRPDLARDELRGRLPRPGRSQARRWSSPTTRSTPS